VRNAQDRIEHCLNAGKATDGLVKIQVGPQGCVLSLQILPGATRDGGAALAHRLLNCYRLAATRYEQAATEIQPTAWPPRDPTAGQDPDPGSELRQQVANWMSDESHPERQFMAGNQSGTLTVRVNATGKLLDLEIQERALHGSAGQLGDAIRGLISQAAGQAANHMLNMLERLPGHAIPLAALQDRVRTAQRGVDAIVG
jgi:DNA-binding protein YbaB